MQIAIIPINLSAIWIQVSIEKNKRLIFPSQKYFEHSKYAYFSACERQSCRENEWNVLIVSSFAVAFPATAAIRSLISEAAAVVKVIDRMLDGSMP